MTGANGRASAASYSPANTCSSTLTRTRQVIGLLVGASSFDIGHRTRQERRNSIPGVVGGNNKAQGCTGVTTPVGDYLLSITHEMGSVRR